MPMNTSTMAEADSEIDAGPPPSVMASDVSTWIAAPSAACSMAPPGNLKAPPCAPSTVREKCDRGAALYLECLREARSEKSLVGVPGPRSRSARRSRTSHSTNLARQAKKPTHMQTLARASATSNRSATLAHGALGLPGHGLRHYLGASRTPSHATAAWWCYELLAVPSCWRTRAACWRWPAEMHGGALARKGVARPDPVEHVAVERTDLRARKRGRAKVASRRDERPHTTCP